MGRPRKHDIGDKYEKLTIVDWVCEKQPSGKSSTFAICECDCGGTIKVLSGNFGRSTKSCGCLKRAGLVKRNTTHGDAGSRLYGIWKAMRKRCNNRNDKEYCNYGGRGIVVCTEWDSYDTFRKWALSNGYGDSLSIDRIENDKGYCPDNCRWATNEQQARNKRNNMLITYAGETLTLSEWSRRVGIPAITIAWRIKNGWDEKEALTTEPKHP